MKQIYWDFSVSVLLLLQPENINTHKNYNNFNSEVSTGMPLMESTCSKYVVSDLELETHDLENVTLKMSSVSYGLGPNAQTLS